MGEIVVFEMTLDGGPQAVRGSKAQWTLKRNGEDLDGTRYSASSNTTTPILFKRAK